MKEEYDGFPLALPPEEAMSAASITKAFLEEMRVQRPAKKFTSARRHLRPVHATLLRWAKRNSHPTPRDAGGRLRYNLGISIRCSVTSSMAATVAADVKVEECTREAQYV